MSNRRWRPRDQTTKSLFDFLRKAPGGLFFGRRHEGVDPPRVPLTIRVAAVGHLSSPKPEETKNILRDIFTDLGQYARGVNPNFHVSLFGVGRPSAPPQIRLISQLASGLDQTAAEILTELRTTSNDVLFEHHIVLPGSREDFEQSIENPTARDAYGKIVTQVERVLELDSEPIGLDFEQAARVILSHADLLIVAVDDNAGLAPGGTKWTEDLAEQADMPVLRIPVQAPQDAVLRWTDDGRRQQRRYDGLSTPTDRFQLLGLALDRDLAYDDVTARAIRLGWFERGYLARLDRTENEDSWESRWTLHEKDILTNHCLDGARDDIDQAFKAAKTWADRRASALAELARGAFIFCMILGAFAIAGALMGLLFPELSKPGKMLELTMLATVLWFVERAHHYSWRAQWLSLRELERCLDQAAWLALTGRSREVLGPAHLRVLNLDPVGLWARAYLNAVRRAAPFPRAAFNRDYLNTVHSLIHRNLVLDQLSYFNAEVTLQSRADERLEKLGKRAVAVASGAAALYLIAACSPVLDAFPDLLKGFGRAASVLGVLLPAIAAALSAIRHNGEYAQIAARYRGTSMALSDVARALDRRLPDASDPCRTGASSAWLAGQTAIATDALLREVQGWNAILRKKSLEVG